MIRLLQILGMIVAGSVLIPVVILLTLITVLSAAQVFVFIALTQFVICVGEVIMEKLNG